MRIELRVSGGVAGVRRPPVVVETAELPAAEAAELEALAARVELPARLPPPSGPDRRIYDLAIGERRGRLREDALTADARALVSRLRRLARAG